MFMESMAGSNSVCRLILFQIWICLLFPSNSHAQKALPSHQNVQGPHHLSKHGCSFPGSRLNSKVTLQQPVSPDGGRFPLPVGTTAVYSCEEPYITLGEAVRFCRPDLTWSGSMPFCGLNVAMHKPLILPADRFAWLTNDGVISTRARDCYAHSFSAGSTFTWKIDLTENFHIHSLRILALADFAWTANVTLQYVSRNNIPVDVHCGRLDYAGTEQTAAVSVPCRKIVPIRFLRIDFTLLSNGRLRLCEVNVLSVDGTFLFTLNSN
ncbi:hypothetical protein RvY_10700 [Ramazzottius varieornatus]|uniref:Sushi domain-containing protein n=1 Tax=Ramazzottius varieornatus TaxID=947166 RepID=A0A1D1VDN2_RAMVA|nr:hypothetical protein RvY_10700 [Ramazzottius varieornatus]